MPNKNKNNFMNNLNPAKPYNNEIYAKMKKYQKIYGFEIGQGEHDAWNNEADAFKHTFMQADLALKTTVGLSKIAGDTHEQEGRSKLGQAASEENMDLWNNSEGRKIAQKIAKQINNPALLKFYALTGQLDDLIANEVMQKMKKGDLITNPNDNRSFQKKMTGSPTGYAVPISTQPFTSQQIGQMTTEEFTQNEQSIMEQLKDGLIETQSEQQKDYSGYVNPISGNSKIFSREDISNLSGQEYSTFEKEIMAQLNSIGVPRNNNLQIAGSKGRAVYVKPYTRDDGTEVKGYYRALSV